MEDQKKYVTPDKFDRIAGSLHNLPVCTTAGPSTIQDVNPLIGQTQTFIVKTVRQREVGDWVFVQYVDDAGAVRLVLPPKVAALIARQAESLTTKNRRQHGKAVAAARKARGELPGFMNGKGKGGRKRKVTGVDSSPAA